MGTGDFNGDGDLDVVVAVSGTLPQPRVQVRSGIDGAVLHEILGGQFTGFGEVVAAVGDFNRDGFDDFAVSAIRENNNRGVVRVFSGSTGAVLHTVTGAAFGTFLGDALAGAGDVDADGFDDVIIGSQSAGEVMVISGATGGVLYRYTGVTTYGVTGCGDANADGFDDFAIGPGASTMVTVYSGATGAVLRAIPTPIPDSTARRALAPAGDIDRDGRPDLLVGMPNANSGAGTASGVVFVVSGRDGSTLYTRRGYALNTSLGWSVGGGGDVNGDGYLDFVAGGPGDATGGSSAGRADVFSGRDGTLLFSFFGAQGYLTGTACQLGDTNRDGIAEAIIGSNGQRFSGSQVSGTVQVVGLGIAPWFPDLRSGQTFNASVGVPLSFTVRAHDVGCAAHILALDATGIPAGLTHSPRLPALGLGAAPSVATRVDWTPTLRDVGQHTLTYIARDSIGRTTSLPVRILVAECYLLLGPRPAQVSLGGSDMLLVDVASMTPVTLTDVPTFRVPDLLGYSVYAQIAMLNPLAFPNDPLQMSHGLQVTMGVGTSPYGAGGSGITMWLTQPPLPGSSVSFRFHIPGM